MEDKLRADLAHLKEQEREYLALVHSTQGAIQYIEHLLNPDSMSLDDFAKMIGGEGAKAEIHESE